LESEAVEEPPTRLGTAMFFNTFCTLAGGLPHYSLFKFLEPLAAVG
jgi:hypothetical protein